ncbi:MAG: hypothetical protein ACQEQN_02790, partial [Thermodesulfobacteriota bacterium]
MNADLLFVVVIFKKTRGADPVSVLPEIDRIVNIDGKVKSPISALRTIFEESHVRLSTLNYSKIARA